MTGAGDASGDDEAAGNGDLFESKLHPPPHRPATVSRAAVLDRLDASRHVPITCVVAPPGYGKTTLLAEWARREPARFAWVSVDRQDNDLAVLMSYTAAALDRVERIEPDLLRTVATRRSASAAASRIAAAISAMNEPVVLVYDHVEALENDECLDAITEVALHVPAGSRLALATRSKSPLPMPRLRASGEVLEVGVDELAMTPAEARVLLRRTGVELDDNELDKVVERTEGWPVGLYLAALALKAGRTQETAGLPFSGDDRLIADYLRSEVLSSLSTQEVEFLIHTSVLDRMSGRLCDAVLETSTSESMLESLARSNLLLVPLDRQGNWYRYHHLFRDLLCSELRRHEPGVVTGLHLRAAAWYEANGLPELAIDHAQSADDPERVNRLVLEHATDAFGAGRSESVRRWLRWFETDGHIDEYPAVAVLGALFFSNTGDAAEAERWSAAAHPRLAGVSAVVAERASPQRVLPDGSTLASLRAILRLVVARDGPEAMRDDARIALDGLSPDNPWRAAATLFEAMSYVLEGDPDQAEPLLARAADIALHARRLPSAIVATAERGFIAVGRDDWASADERAQQALSLVEAVAFDDYPESALALVLGARVATHRRDAQAAGDYATRAARLRPLLTYSRPAISLRALLELARAYVELGDTSGAHAVVRQARDVLEQRPQMGTLPEDIAALQSRLEAMRTGRVGASSLTAAELRLVPLLPTHLTFPQIGERLFISRSTVKTHATSIYQKLGVSSRSEAVEQLRVIGLLQT